MIDKQQENQVSLDVVPKSGDIAASVVEKSSKNSAVEQSKSIDKKQNKSLGASKGEEVFDSSTYVGLNYFVNLITSMAIADYFLNGKGRARLNNGISTLTTGLKKMSVPIKTSHHLSKVGLETFAFTSGGLVLLAPLKWMEDNKRKIVHWTNKKLGVDQQAADGHEKTSDEIYIKNEQPKQSWGNVIWRRIEATATVIIAGLGLDHFARDKNGTPKVEKYTLNNGEKIVYDAKVMGGKERVENKVFGWIDRVGTAVRGKKCVEGGMASRWTKIAILDSVFTVITAAVMKITSGGKKAKMPNEIDDSNDPAVVKDSLNVITTTADVEKNHQLFSNKIEQRVRRLIDYKNSTPDSKGSFVEGVQSKETPIVGIGA
ncbi:MAG: hypothetical protein ABL857_04760 [Rickettsiales bacterium]